MTSQTLAIPDTGSQTRLVSLIESGISTGIGYAVSFILWQTIGPLFGYHVTLMDNFWFTNIFTVASIARQYGVRRAFNAGLHGRVVLFVRGLTKQ